MITWVQCIQQLAKAAEFQSQAAYAALSWSVQFEWTFSSRVVPDCSALFESIRHAIIEKFWPTLFSESVSELEQSIFFLPVGHGGLGISDSVHQAGGDFSSAQCCTAETVSAIKGLNDFSGASHVSHVLMVRIEAAKEKCASNLRQLEGILELRDPKLK